MKKTLLLVLILGSFFCLKAQEGEILYTNFEPDNCIDHPYNIVPNPIEIDLNQDGMIDVVIHNWIESTQVAWIAVETGWLRRLLNNDDPNDTIVPSNEYDWNGTHLPFYNSGIGHHEGTYGFRKRNGDGKYNYAWMHFYIDRTSISQVSVCVDQYAYCTIPDYPLHWGQTSLNWAVEENSEISAGIHPNPAKDFITIDLPNEGDCQSIEIFSIDGLLLETFPETSQHTQIDISGLRAGMYIMKIKMADGKEFSERIVKE